MRISAFILLNVLFIAGLLGGCSKDPAITEIHKDTIIDGNNPPPYGGVSDDKINAYINKLYIDLIGRAPTTEEINDKLSYLDSNNLSSASRDTIISGLMQTDAYFDRLFYLTSNDFLNGTDSAAISVEIVLIQLLYAIDSAAGNTLNMLAETYELGRLNTLQNITADFKAGNVSLNAYYAAFVNNYFYDQVNMGTENFVKATFDDLFGRPPTTSELEQSENMVNNVASILFLQDGDSKGDYINIVTTCDAFYEGVVKKIFEQLLLRDPDSEEQGTYTTQLKSDNSLQHLQESIMTGAEYAGF